MKRLKRLLTIGLAGLLMFCMSLSFVGCSFSFKDLPTPDYSFTYGDFRCCYVTSATSNMAIKKERAVGVNVFGLVEEAKEKETIVIPETIDGLPVIAIGMKGLGWSVSLMQKGVQYKKLYLPNSLLTVCDEDDIRSPSGRKKIFFYNDFNFVDFENRIRLLQNIEHGMGTLRVFVSEILYQEYQNLENINILDSIQIANLTYMVDNEVYWIDDYEEGEKIIFPIEPTKDGFRFDGWYKEIEFETEWREDVDTYYKPESAKTLKLYAKFVEEQ